MTLGMTTALPSDVDLATRLTRPELRRYLERYVRRRVSVTDAEDAIQAVLCAALEARQAPSDGDELRMWLTGIARRKIAALYAPSAIAERTASREVEHVEALPAPLEAASLLRWAERQAATVDEKRGDETLDWMARESDGEKLETIAADAKLPAAQVRQRVSRMRRWMRARWVAELAAVMAVLVAIGLVVRWYRAPDESATKREIKPQTLPEPTPERLPPVRPPERDRSHDERAYELLRRGDRECTERQFERCIHTIDELELFDPHGTIGARGLLEEMRREAVEQLAKEAAPKPSPRTSPSTSKPPSRKSKSPTTGMTPGGSE